MMRRERRLLARRLPIASGDVLSVGCGWHPGRHLFEAPAFRLVAVDADPDRAGFATTVHATHDDLPLPPRRLNDHARGAGLRPERHAVTYTWRRLPPPLQRALQPLDALGSRPRAAPF